MERDELTLELTHPGARELLDQATLCRLAYNGQDGYPRVIPIAFYWTGEQLVVCTAPTSPKARALRERPDVAVTIDTGDTPDQARELLIRGVAEIETVDGVPDEYLAASKKSLTPEQFAQFEQAVGGMYEQMERISIEPRWARFYDFGAGRFPRFLSDLASGQ